MCLLLVFAQAVCVSVYCRQVIVMPGDNCAIFNCGTCRSTKYSGVAIFKYPGKTGIYGKSADEQAEWRREFLSKITRDRVVDEKFQKQIDKGDVFVCEKHFNPDDIIRGKNLFIWFSLKFNLTI